MAVFTTVSKQDAQELLSQYSIGELVSLQGITAGIENTNYFLTTTHGEFVLTLFEVLTHEQLPFYIELMHYLAEKGLAVPQPQTLNAGGLITTLHNKPCSIVTKLSGGYEAHPSSKHCALTASHLAQVHIAAKNFHIKQPNLRSIDWWVVTAPKIRPFLSAEQTNLLDISLAEQVELYNSPEYKLLPNGPSHCDLFRDNVLFDGTFMQPRMSGFIDFYFAGCDTWLFDVAVSVNDWCIKRETGELKPDKYSAWLSSYTQIRPFTDLEKQYWPIMLRAAALRFWISRLYDYYIPRPAQTLKPHDPRHFERILRLRHENPVTAIL